MAIEELISTEMAQALVARYTPAYRLVRPLGEGTFGRVFLVEDGLKQVAVKIVLLAFGAGGNPDGERTGEKEWRRLTTPFLLPSHPALVRVREFFHHREEDAAARVRECGLIYMDYWPATLRDCLRRLRQERRLSAARRRALLLTLAQHLERLRADTGWLVTDLKVDNILVGSCEAGPLPLAIGDLGGLHRLGGAVVQRVESTATCWAPEIHDGVANEVDETALVYSYGLIGFHILEGRRPFRDSGLPTHQAIRAAGGVDWTPGRNAGLEGCKAVVDRCLRERSERYGGFAEVVRDLTGERQRWWRRQRGVAPPAMAVDWREPISGLELVWVAGGRFAMGQADRERAELIHRLGRSRYDDWYSRERPRHEVTLDGFWMARHPVTRGQFGQFVEEWLHLTEAEREGWAHGVAPGQGWGERPGLNWRQPGFAQGDDHPVVCVSWFDAQQFVAWLVERTGLPFALPSEAQWEYACRAGRDSRYGCGATITNEQANFGDHQGGTTPAGRYPPNRWGLHDLHGNVWEWCRDGYDADFYASAMASQPNPVCEHGAGYRVRRGGSWSYQQDYLRCAYRGRNYPDSRYADIGFRVVLQASEAK